MASGTSTRLLVVASRQAETPKCRCIYLWLTGSLLAFDVDSSERSLLGSLEDHAGFASRETDAAVILALDQVLSTMVADELYAIARSSVGIFVFALKGKPFHNGIKADVWLIPVKSWLACVYMHDKGWTKTYDLQIVESAARRSRETIMSNK